MGRTFHFMTGSGFFSFSASQSASLSHAVMSVCVILARSENT